MALDGFARVVVTRRGFADGAGSRLMLDFAPTGETAVSSQTLELDAFLRGPR